MVLGSRDWVAQTGLSRYVLWGNMANFTIWLAIIKLRL